MDNYINLTAIFSNHHTGGFHVYIEEIPEVCITARTFDKAIDYLKIKLQKALKNNTRLRVAVRYKHVLFKKIPV